MAPCPWSTRRGLTAGTTIYAPSAGGYQGWSIGRAVAEHFGRDFILADINPLHPSIETEDYLTAEPPPGPLTIITNPPYEKLLELFLRKALKDCGRDGEVVFIIPYLWLSAVDRASGWSSGEPEETEPALILPKPTHIWQPAKRVEFELTPEDAEVRRQLNAQEGKRKKVAVKKSKKATTGNTIGSPAGAHVWVRWEPESLADTLWDCQPVLPRHLLGEEMIDAVEPLPAARGIGPGAKRRSRGKAVAECPEGSSPVRGVSGVPIAA